MKRICVIVLCLFCMLWAGSRCEAVVIGNDWQYLTADSQGKWKYFDFGRFQSPIPGNNREAWLEVPILPAEPWKNTLLFSIDGQAVEVFVDGSKVYADGDFSSRFLGHGKKWHMVELPYVPHETMLLFHLYADYPHQLGVFKNFIVDNQQNQARRIFAVDFPYIITLPVAVLLSMVTFMYLFNRPDRRRMNIKLLILMLLMTLWTISLSNVKQFLWNVPVIWRFLENFICYLLPVAANSIIVEVLEEDLRLSVKRVVKIYAALAALALTLELAGFDGLVMCRQLLYAAVLCLQVFVFRNMWEAIKRKNIYAQFAMVPMIVMGGLGIADGVLLYLHFWRWHVYLLPLGIYACSSFVVCMVREQVIRERELEAHAEELLAEIAATMAKAELDELTGCRNRGAFEDFIRQQIAGGKAFSLVMMDIDYFKEINDHYGHEAGDRVLYQFSEVVRSQLAGKQEFFRWGGEEFVIYCQGLNREQARELAEKIRHQVEIHQFFRHRQITVSAGVAQWYDGNDSQVGIFRRMDDALYAAKCNGRNQVVME
ncbi:GGDEF domain-containing protein [Selenomonas ruminantium]|uniref:GGDEF domain-containing protein n=1 Tax=Selenomonas ruminantium TaxID=971 RepID=UPI0026EF14E3|nr:GGDEF domain-containing protein [Selenomonas ruminantium]